MPKRNPNVYRAADLVEAGTHTTTEAARECGVTFSSVWMALERRRKPTNGSIGSTDADPLEYPISEEFIARFWSKVAKQEGDGCWLWTAGRFERYGAVHFHGQSRQAHRVSLRIAGVTLSKGLVVDHTCKNRLCVRPDHLRLVTQGTNTTENSESNFAKNKAKTHCVRGHPLSGENLARFLKRYKPGGKLYPQRSCLTCYPQYANLRLRFWLPEDLAAAPQISE